MKYVLPVTVYLKLLSVIKKLLQMSHLLQPTIAQLLLRNRLLNRYLIIISLVLRIYYGNEKNINDLYSINRKSYQK